MSGKWDFSSCSRQAGRSACGRGRRGVLGVVWWELGARRVLWGAGRRWGPGLSQIHQAPGYQALGAPGSVRELADPHHHPGRSRLHPQCTDMQPRPREYK